MKIFHLERSVDWFLGFDGELVEIFSDQGFNEVYSLLVDMKISNFTVVIEDGVGDWGGELIWKSERGRERRRLFGMMIGLVCVVRNLFWGLGFSVLCAA